AVMLPIEEEYNIYDYLITEVTANKFSKYNEKEKENKKKEKIKKIKKEKIINLCSLLDLLKTYRLVDHGEWVRIISIIFNELDNEEDILRIGIKYSKI